MRAVSGTRHVGHQGEELVVARGRRLLGVCEGGEVAGRGLADGTGGAARGGLVALLAAIGTVASFEGARGVIQGARQVVDGGAVSANVDSEYRFYSAWYAVLGVLVLGAARHPEREARVVRATAAGFLAAACGRALSARSAGPPHPLQRGLLAIELVLPAVLVPWQARVSRRSPGSPARSRA